MKQAVFCIFLFVGTFSSLAESITRIACVGDSITYGAAIRDRAKTCYPKVLGDLLGGKYSVCNYGVNGATLLRKGDKPYWKLKAFEEATKFAPNIVIIKLGTNDPKPQNWGKAGDEYEADLRARIAHFQNLAREVDPWAALWAAKSRPTAPLGSAGPSGRQGFPM